MAQSPAAKTPALAVLDPADAPQWQAGLKDLGWRIVTLPAHDEKEVTPAIDVRVQALAAAVEDAIKNSGVDPERVYLVGRGDAAAAVLYAISRMPDLWAAGLAVGGSPQAAVDSDRIFTANFTNVPVLWIGGAADDQAVAAKLKQEGLNLEWKPAAGTTNAAIFEWLTKRRRDAFPAEIDCETNSPNFARCYWIQMAKFDANERNDVLPTTHMRPGNSAALDLGGFGFKLDDPGPGVLVSKLPEKYDGPLKVNDRLVAWDGREIADAKQYVERLKAVTQEQPVVVTVQRGKERIRLETRFVVQRRDLMVTARVEAQYLPADHEIQIVSRTVKEMRVTIPPEWAGSRLYWNGLVLEKVDNPGCLLLTVDKELLHANKCP